MSYRYPDEIDPAVALRMIASISFLTIAVLSVRCSCLHAGDW